MGRVKLDLADKRSYRAKLRFTESEFEFMKELHEMYEKMDFAVFARKMLLDHASKIVFTKEVDKNTFDDVQKIGLELNKIAKQLNKKSADVYREEHLLKLQEINNSLKEIKETLNL